MYTEWCIGASILLSALSLIVAGTKNDTGGSSGVFIILVSTGALILIVLGLTIYREPQIIKERAVELGVGRFIADEKGNVDFYFIKHDGTEVIYKNLNNATRR